MAIDYEKEWKKLRAAHGSRVVLQTDAGYDVNLKCIMGSMIRDTINDREKLMKEFVTQKLTINIIQQDKHYYCVDIVIDGGTFGSYNVSKNEFHTWLKNRKKVK